VYTAIDRVWKLGSGPDGDSGMSLGNVLTFGFVIWASVQISKFIRFLLQEDVLNRLTLPRGVPYAISVATHYTLLLVGFFLALSLAEVDMTKFTVLAGALGVGVGFGLQNVVNNFVSGLILLFERPVKVGDTVELVGGTFGDIRRIGIRSSTVRTFDGAEVIVPNASLISETVTNWTLSDKQRRIKLAVGVAYGTDPQQVLELLGKVAADHEDVLDEPAPAVLFRGFGDSSLDFEIRAWTGDFDRGLGVVSELGVAVNGVLAEAGIEIPFPQRDLHVRSVDATVGEALGRGTPAASQAPREPTTRPSDGGERIGQHEGSDDE
jgi:small-conductance mechanosensitive channel